MRYSPVIPPRPNSPHRRMRRLLERALGPGITLSASGYRPWASANFVGERHFFDCVVLRDMTPDLRSIIERNLSEVEWPLAGHIVADVSVCSASCNADEANWRIEILTVED